MQFYSTMTSDLKKWSIGDQKIDIHMSRNLRRRSLPTRETNPITYYDVDKKKTSSSWDNVAWRVTLRDPSRWDKKDSVHTNDHWTTGRPAHDHSGNLSVIISTWSRSIPLIFQLFLSVRHPVMPNKGPRQNTSCWKGYITHPSQTSARCTIPRLLPSLVPRLFSTLRMDLSHASESPHHYWRNSIFSFISSSFLAFEFCPSRFFQESTQTFYNNDSIQRWRFTAQDGLPRLWRNLLFSSSTPASSVLPATPCSLLFPILLVLHSNFIFVASKSSILQNDRQFHHETSVCLRTFLQRFYLFVTDDDGREREDTWRSEEGHQRRRQTRKEMILRDRGMMMN